MSEMCDARTICLCMGDVNGNSMCVQVAAFKSLSSPKVSGRRRGKGSVARIAAVLRKYIRAQKFTGDSFSGGDLKERSNEPRLTYRIATG